MRVLFALAISFQVGKSSYAAQSCLIMFQSPLENSQIDAQIHAKTALLDNRMNTIIIRRALLKRWCWNWQTGMVEGHVSKDVEVQVLSSAPMQQKSP